jgi:hypothetical protein
MFLVLKVYEDQQTNKQTFFWSSENLKRYSDRLFLFGWANKPAEKHCCLICCERKIRFQLKKQAEKTDYKPGEQAL